MIFDRDFNFYQFCKSLSITNILLDFFFKICSLPNIYEVRLKSNETLHAAQTNFYRREKSIAFYDVTMSYSFENQISAICDNYIVFCTFFCQGTFFVTVL